VRRRRISGLVRVAVTLIVVAASGVSTALAATPQQHALADALQAMHARSGLAHLAHHNRSVVIVSGLQEAQWKGYIAASVYAARGNPLRSVRLVRPGPIGNVTLHFPAVNCACAYPGMNRLRKIRPATRPEVVQAIRGAAQREGARVDCIELLHPLTYAPIVTVTAPHPRRFLRQAKATLLVQRLYRRIEGAYIIVRGPGGRVFANGGYTGRSYEVFGEVGWAIAV